MRDIRVALGQVSPRLGDVDANLELHRERIARARQAGAGLVVFPELSLTGYLLRDQTPEVALRTDDALLEPLRRESRDIDVLFGLVELADDLRYFNTAVYLAAGEISHRHRKIYLPTYGMFDEGREFARGDRLRSFETGYGRAGVLICEDAWHGTSAWLLAHQGAQVLFVPSCGPTRGARPEGVTSVAVWRQLLQVTAQFQTSYVVYVNRVGVEDGLTFGGGSMVVDPFGRVAAELDPLDEGFAVVELEGEVARRARTAYPLLRDDDLDLVRGELERLRRIRFELPAEEEDAP